MKNQDMMFPPHVLTQIAFEQERAEQERRAAVFEAERGRYADAAADDSPGRRAARVAARRVAAHALQRKTEIHARENQPRAEWITHRFETDGPGADE
jgi:hypothetical protein